MSDYYVIILGANFKPDLITTEPLTGDADLSRGFCAVTSHLSTFYQSKSLI